MAKYMAVADALELQTILNTIAIQQYSTNTIQKYLSQNDFLYIQQQTAYLDLSEDFDRIDIVQAIDHYMT